MYIDGKNCKLLGRQDIIDKNILLLLLLHFTSVTTITITTTTITKEIYNRSFHIILQIAL